MATGRHTVTAISRPGSQNKLPRGVKAVHVNYSDEAGLVAALKGQQFLVITMSVLAPRDSHSKLVRAAAKAGVPYVMPNWYGSDIRNDELVNATVVGPAGKANCKEIEDLGVSAWVALCCGFWYEFSLAGTDVRLGFDFDKRSVTLFDEDDVKISTSTWEQCGRAVAAVLSLKELPEDAADRSLTVSSFRNGPIYAQSFVISQRDMYESVKRVTGTTDADWTVTKQPAKERYEEGTKQFKTGDMAGLGKMLYSRTFFKENPGNFSAKAHNKVLGLPQEDLDERTKIAVEMAARHEQY